MSRRGWIAILCGVVGGGVFASVAIAANPQFTKKGAPTCTDTGTQLVCQGELTGLGNADRVIET